MSAKYFSMSALLRRHSERIAHSERKAIQDDTWEPNERKAIQDDTFRVIRDGSRARIEGRTYSGEWESICDTPHGSDFTDEELIRYSVRDTTHLVYSKPHIVFTTSPASFDFACSAELEHFQLEGRQWRKVLVDLDHPMGSGQMRRYTLCQEEDPREQLAQAQAEAARWAAFRAQLAEERAQDLAALTAMPFDVFMAEFEKRHNLVYSREIPSTTEQERAWERVKELLPKRQAEELEKAWDALCAKIPNGVDILVPAVPPEPWPENESDIEWKKAYFGPMKSRGWRAELFHVIGPAPGQRGAELDKRKHRIFSSDTNEESTGSSQVIASYVEKGYIVQGYPPPIVRRKLFQRTGLDILRLYEDHKREVGGKIYFLVKDQVFDAETGNLCRSRKIAEQVRRLP